MIRLLLADDSTVTRQALAAVLECDPELHLVAEAWDGRSAVAAARAHQPDVALVDIDMPGTDGIEAARELRLLPAPPKVLMLTMLGQDGYVDDAIRAGASGYLLKDTPTEQLLAHIHTVHHGRHVLDPAVTGGVLSRIAASPAPPAPDGPLPLSRSEEGVLRLVCRGLTNHDIAGRLGTSETAVKSKVSRLMTKLDADNRVQLARVGIRAGLDDY
ncbi:response regulator transcription factor [Streptomyces sp. NPDC001941]|uniref:response regulator transcription factor n=1 Tax=Streptomyces sp. NPDC001941 TaxID=3154659 RepID=UPI0033300019